MHTTMKLSDGSKDSWGESYLHSVYENIGTFDAAIKTLGEAIEALEEYKRVYEAAAELGIKYWDDYWHTEHLRKSMGSCSSDLAQTIEELKEAKANLVILVGGTRYTQQHFSTLMKKGSLNYNC